MKVKINQKLLGVDGKTPLINPNEKGGRPLTLRDVCITSILVPTDEKEDERKKFEKYEIFKKLRGAKEEVTLKAEEIAVIKKAVAFHQPPLVMGQAFDMIEGRDPGNIPVE